MSVVSTKDVLKLRAEISALAYSHKIAGRQIEALAAHIQVAVLDKVLLLAKDEV